MRSEKLPGRPTRTKILMFQLELLSQWPAWARPAWMPYPSVSTLPTFVSMPGNQRPGSPLVRQDKIRGKPVQQSGANEDHAIFDASICNPGGIQNGELDETFTVLLRVLYILRMAMIYNTAAVSIPVKRVHAQHGGVATVTLNPLLRHRLSFFQKVEHFLAIPLYHTRRMSLL